MATSSRGFGVLKPPKRNKGKEPLQPHSEEPYYSQFTLQINPQPRPRPPRPPPPAAIPRPVHQHYQHYHHHYQHGHHPQQPPQHGPPQHAANPPPNGNIHPHYQPQPRPPNGLPPGAIAPPAPASSTDATAPQSRRPGRPRKRPRSGSDNQVEPIAAAAAAPSPPVPVVPRVPPRPPSPHPFNRGPYNTLEDAIFSLQLHVFTSGYGVSQKRTVKEKLASGKYDPDGAVIRKDYACDKGGNEFVSHSRGQRRRESKKCGCPWKAAVRRLRREGDRWYIEILDNQHNHAVTSPDEMHTLASYRRWQRENNAGIRSAIACLTRAADMPARDIAAYLRGEVEDPDLARVDTQILRALSMNDKELPGSEKEGGPIVFEILARRPVIILQDKDKTSSTGPTKGDLNHTSKAAPTPMNNDEDDNTLPHETTTPTATTPTLPEAPVNHRQAAPAISQTAHSPRPRTPPPADGADE